MTHTGALWRPLLPPGVYQDRPVTTPRPNLRSDVCAFVGLAERGPVCTPVVLDSFESYLYAFGGEGSNRMLPRAVRLFFENGGRRCVVLRTIDYARARTARHLIGQATHARLLHVGDGAPPARVALDARSPGRWGNRLRGRISPVLLPVRVDRHLEAGIPSLEWLVDLGDPIERGATIRLVAPSGGSQAPRGELYRVVDSKIEDGQRLVRLDRDAQPEQLGRAALLDARELRVDLELWLQGEPAVREVWRELALDPLHGRFMARVLGRPGPAETHLRRPLAGLESIDVETRYQLEEEVAASQRESRLRGSALAILPVESWSGHLELAGVDETRLGSGRIPPIDLVPAFGDDTQDPLAGFEDFAATNRSVFFSAPGDLLAHDDARWTNALTHQPAPLEAIEDHDDRTPIEPVSLVHFPDLLHPDPRPPFETGDDRDDRDAFTFGDCEGWAPWHGESPRDHYPELLWDEPGADLASRRADLETAQRRLVDAV